MIPEGIRFIGENAFHECLGLKRIYYNAISCDFKANLDISINNYLNNDTSYHGVLSPFTYGKDVKYHQYPYYQTFVYPVSVTFGPKVERLSAFLLNKQQHLTSITLPETLQVIGDYAFADTGIKRVSLPESVVSLGLGVFYNAPLTRLASHRDYPPYCALDMSPGNHALSGLDYAQCELQVPEGKKEFYQSSFPWSLFENITEIPDGPKSRDLNGDGVVDIADLNIAINLMLGKGDPNVTLDQADLNDDGVVDIADLNMFINAMLGKD